MHAIIDAIGIRGHGGAAVLCELLHWLPTVRPDWNWHVLLFNRDLREFDDPPVPGNVILEHVALGNSGRERLTWVNRHLPNRLNAMNADLLFSFANIGSARSLIPQVVFCHQLNAFFAGGVASGALVKRARLWFMRKHILRGALASRAMIVQTDAMRTRIMQLEPRLRGRVHVIPSGYRTPVATPVIRPEKKALIDGASRPRLIYVSHPSEHKNHETLVRSLRTLVKSMPEANLLLTIERNRTSDSRYMSFVRKIEQTAQAEGVAKHLAWLGLLNSDEVDYALQASDLMVFPSLAESFGLGLVEAMAADCPVVAADLPYAHDVCAEAALYFDPASPEALAEAARLALESECELARLRKAARDRKSRFSYGKIAGDIADVMEQNAMQNA